MAFITKVLEEMWLQNKKGIGKRVRIKDNRTHPEFSNRKNTVDAKILVAAVASRYQYFIAKWHARTIVVVLTGIAAGWIATPITYTSIGGSF